MKNNKKKVISAMLAISIMIPQVQSQAIQCNPTNEAYKSVMSEIGQINKDRGILGTFLSYFFVGQKERNLYNQKDTLLDLKGRETVSCYPVSFVESALTNSKMKSRCLWDYIFSFGSGVFNTAFNMFFNPYSLLPTILISSLFSWFSNYYNSRDIREEAKKIERPTDQASTIGLLNTIMDDSIKGQEKAKKQVRSMILNIVDKNIQYKYSADKKTAGPGANVIYMVGASGVGKTMMANVIHRVLNGPDSEVFSIEAADIDPNSGSVVQQLFGVQTKRMNNSDIKLYTPLIQRVKNIPNSVIVINEWDKIQPLAQPKSQSQQQEPNPLDEALRTILDRGYLIVNGEKIDFTATTIIITSNESSGSVNKGNNEADNTVDDGTGSRRTIHHDKAFLNRVKLIEFENLKAAEYKEIAIRPFYQLVLRYKLQYGINIDLNGTIDAVAQRVEEQNKGARPIYTYLEALNDKLLNEVVLQNLNSGNNSGLNYRVSFENDEFKLERLDDNKASAEKDNSVQEDMIDNKSKAEKYNVVKKNEDDNNAKAEETHEDNSVKEDAVENVSLG